MSKLTIHRILIIVISTIISVILHSIFPQMKTSNTVGFFEGVIFCITWDIILCKPSSFKDKYSK